MPFEGTVMGIVIARMKRIYYFLDRDKDSSAAAASLAKDDSNDSSSSSC
jgi:hypothetical protein